MTPPTKSAQTELPPPAGPGADAALPRLQHHGRQWLALLLGLLAVAAVLAVDLRHQHTRTGQQAEERLRQQARVLDQALARQFEAIDAALAGIVQSLSSRSNDGAWANANRRLMLLDAAITGTRTLVLLDADGRAYAANRPELVGLSFAERAYFQEARDGNDALRLYVTAPFRSALGVWSLNLTRVVRHPDGRFAGIVTASLDPEWLGLTLGAVNFAPDMWAALAHSGGRLLLMVPELARSIEGVDLAVPGSMFVRHRDAGQAETAFSGPIVATGEHHRLIVQRTVRPAGLDMPQTVALALSRDRGAVYADWRSRAIGEALFFVLLAALSCGGLALMQGADRRAAQADAAARLALQAQERRWMLALASSGLGVWDSDLRSGHEYHSPQWWAMLGVGDDGIEDHLEGWRRRLHPDDEAEATRRFVEHVAGQTPAYEAEYRLRAADGSYRWMLSRGRAVERAADGRALRIVGTLLDITDRREAETLRAERDRADAASRAKTEFVSRMSHELRTPLNAVLGFAQLLSAGDGRLSPATQRDYVRRIEEGGWHLLELVNDVLDLARVESGQLAMALQPVPLAAVLQRAADSMAALAQRRGLPLHLAPVPAHAAVQADPQRLRDVLVNLLGNAIKYNRPGGDVRVELGAGPGVWRIAVVDSGIGMSTEQQGQLFEPFNRLGHANSAIEGSGLGLVLTRWYVEMMGGRLEVRSEPGVGSRFTVELPAADGPAPGPDSTAP
ncbi:MAG: ATP-binding protein [Rubrivivax sp.]|nr:ATP-binding protein [Rubrivivax sp.]